MRRRQFLRSASWMPPLPHVVGASMADAQPTSRDLSLFRATHRAMATAFELLLPVGISGACAIALAEQVFESIDTWEDRLTIYRDGSEISDLNRRAAREPVPVAEDLFDLLERCAAWHRQTQGAFDIATGALSQVWGFTRRQGRVPSPRELCQAMEHTGFRHVVLDPEARTVRYRRTELTINLGGVGKGFTLDQVGTVIRQEWNVLTALLHGGFSSVLALGAPEASPRGWPIAIRHPNRPERSLGIVYLRDRALGTSAATFQFFEHRGRKYGHILDPRNGQPAQGMALASVVAPTAAEADALSTAFFVLGVTAAQRYCQSHPQVGAILLADAEDAPPIVLGLDASEWFPAITDSPAESVL